MRQIAQILRKIDDRMRMPPPPPQTLTIANSPANSSVLPDNASDASSSSSITFPNG